MVIRTLRLVKLRSKVKELAEFGENKIKAIARENRQARETLKKSKKISIIQKADRGRDKDIINRVKDKYAPPFDSIITLGQGEENIYMNITNGNIRQIVLPRLRQTLICRSDFENEVMVIIKPEITIEQIREIIELVLEEELNNFYL